jgi:erythromycin esterase
VSRGMRFLLVGAIALLSSPGVFAQVPEDTRTAFLEWATRSLHPVTHQDMNAPVSDLRPLRNMIGDATIVGLSEGVHGGAEPLAFRNRLFRYLVEELGFDAIAIESGIIESRLIHDYVAEGQGDFEAVVQQGLSWTFDTYPQNRELIRWMKDYNSKLPSSGRKLQFFGFDVAGSPGNPSAIRGPETALDESLRYLGEVDPHEVASIRSRAGAFLTNGMSGYQQLDAPRRDVLTAASC